MGVEQGKITLEDSFKCDDEKYTDVYVYVTVLVSVVFSLIHAEVTFQFWCCFCCRSSTKEILLQNMNYL